MEIWINLWGDPVAGLRSLSSNMCLADLKNEADSNFVVADLKKKLRIYKGTSIAWESSLLDIPSAIAVYYPELNSPPNLAVASGNSIYIYKNSRPFFKFTLPLIEISSEEIKVWEDLKENRINIDEACTFLGSLRDSEITISARSAELLSYDKENEKIEYLESVMDIPIIQTTSITCLGVVYKDSELETGCSMLIIGTENKGIYILDQTGSSILKKIILSYVPVFISSIGIFSSESRIVVACRESKIVSIKNGILLSNTIELETPPSSLVVLDKYIFVGSYDNKVHCFHMKGRKLYTLFMKFPISCMTILKLTRTRVFKGLIVALNNGDIRLYKDKVLLNCINIGESIQGMCFGSYGKEEGVLAINLKSGGIIMKKIDKRTNFEGKIEFNGPPHEQEIPLVIPAKSKLYLEQVDRERENAYQMYKGFLKDLVSVKLRTAKTFMKLENTESNSKNTGINVRMSAYVQGLGPSFSIILEVENTGKELCPDIRVGYSYDPSLFKVTTLKSYFPLLVPGLKYRQNLSIQSLQGASENIRVFLITSKSVLPVISAFINIPSCEDIN
jgi:Bardet-Biedl syndrome 1 protein